MSNITLFDTSVCTRNLGDQIIMDAVRKELLEVFEDGFFLNVPTHDYLSEESYKVIDISEYSFVGGTNLLSANMNKYNQWKINLKDIFKFNDAILMGVGWWQYQHDPNRYTRYLLRKVLSNKMMHSVRDEYTANKLRYAGIQNVLNTGCPTLWKLSEEHCKDIPTTKAKNAVMTFTDYKPNIGADKRLFEIVSRNYEKVFIWIQGSRDKAYIESVIGNSKNVEIIKSTLEAYDNILKNTDNLDYIGTRLHAGIRAMQHRRRSVIISVDNRATEMGKNFNLNVVERKDVNEKLLELINGPIITNIELPLTNIAKWKNQFKKSM